MGETTKRVPIHYVDHHQDKVETPRAGRKEHHTPSAATQGTETTNHPISPENVHNTKYESGQHKKNTYHQENIKTGAPGASTDYGNREWEGHDDMEVTDEPDQH